MKQSILKGKVINTKSKITNKNKLQGGSISHLLDRPIVNTGGNVAVLKNMLTNMSLKKPTKKIKF